MEGKSVSSGFLGSTILIVSLVSRCNEGGVFGSCPTETSINRRVLQVVLTFRI